MTLGPWSDDGSSAPRRTERSDRGSRSSLWLSEPTRAPRVCFPGAVLQTTGPELCPRSPSPNTSPRGPGGRERGGRGGRRCEPGPTTYLVDSLKSSLEGSCSSRSQQASTSWGGTSGTWSSLWGRTERVRPSEQSPGVPPGKEKPTETAPKCFGSSGKSSAGAHRVDFALSLLPG